MTPPLSPQGEAHPHPPSEQDRERAEAIVTDAIVGHMNLGDVPVELRDDLAERIACALSRVEAEALERAARVADAEMALAERAGRSTDATRDDEWVDARSKADATATHAHVAHACYDIARSIRALASEPSSATPSAASTEAAALAGVERERTLDEHEKWGALRAALEALQELAASFPREEYGTGGSLEGAWSVQGPVSAAHGPEWEVSTRDGRGVWVARTPSGKLAALIAALRNALPALLNLVEPGFLAEPRQADAEAEGR